MLCIRIEDHGFASEPFPCESWVALVKNNIATAISLLLLSDLLLLFLNRWSEDLLTYLDPLHEEKRPSTTSRHLTRSWAAFITPFQQVSFCAISVSVLRLQLLRGRPLFLFPCGFHLRAWRVVLFGGFLKVWPIQDHILLRICLETGFCPALSHNTSFLSLSDHLIPNILLRHVLRNFCSCLCTFPVVFHVWQP